MKLIYVFSIFLVFASSEISAQKNIDQILRKYKNDEGVTNLNFSGDILKSMAGADKSLKSIIEHVDIIIFQNKDDISTDDKSKIKSVISRDKFDLLIDVKNKGQKIQLFATESGPFLNKVYAYVNSPDMNAYFILHGKIILEELSKLGMDFQKGQFLDIISDEKGKK